MNLIFLGPQGCGKGTQADILAEKLGLFHVSTGAALREAAAKDDAFGREIAALMSHGKLVSDEAIVKVVGSQLTPERFKQGIIFDGTPRLLPQVGLLDRLLAENNAVIDRVFFLNISEKETFRRLSGRVVCANCGQNFNLLTKPPAKEGFCDICAGPLQVRADETPTAISERLAIYHSQTLPVLDVYRQRGILEEVDGERSIEIIAADIFSRLEGLGLIK